MTLSAADFARARLGSNMEARMAMIVITTRSSIKVKKRLLLPFWIVPSDSILVVALLSNDRLKVVGFGAGEQVWREYLIA